MGPVSFSVRPPAAQRISTSGGARPDRAASPEGRPIRVPQTIFAAHAAAAWVAVQRSAQHTARVLQPFIHDSALLPPAIITLRYTPLARAGSPSLGAASPGQGRRGRQRLPHLPHPARRFGAAAAAWRAVQGSSRHLAHRSRRLGAALGATDASHHHPGLRPAGHAQQLRPLGRGSRPIQALRKPLTRPTSARRRMVAWGLSFPVQVPSQPVRLDRAVSCGVCIIHWSA